MKRKIIWAIVLAAFAGISWQALRALGEIGKHPDKVWLHRCNSLEKLQEKHAEYPNFEVDLVYRKDGVFDVTHDSLKSINLNFAAYLQNVQNDTSHIWLDVKNLTQANARAMKLSLDSLLLRYNISKKRLIIESRNWQGLGTFTRDGYFTSCYVDYDKPSRLSKGEIQLAIKQLQKVVTSGNACALSFAGWWYDDIKQAFANQRIALLTWEHRKNQFELFFSARGKRMIEDPQLQVILVKDKGHYHR